MPLMVAPLMDPPALLHRVKFEPNTELPAPLVQRGTTGTCSAVRLQDGEIVGVTNRRSLLGRSRNATGPSAGLSAHLDALGDRAASTTQLAFEVGDIEVAQALLAEARVLGLMDRLLIIATTLDHLVELRQETAATRLIYRCSPKEHPGGPERLASSLRDQSIDGTLMPEIDLTAGTVALFHRFRRLLMADGADYERTVRRALKRGVDGVIGSDAQAFDAAAH